MTIVRFSLGGVALLLSLLGFLACLAGVAGVWMLEGKVETVGNVVFSAADESLGFVDAKADQVQQAMQNSRQRVRGIAKTAQRLLDARADVRKEIEPLLQALAEVREQVQAAESWLDSCRVVAQGVGRVSEAVVSSEYAAAHAESTGVALAERAQAAAEAVAEALARLHAVRQELIAVREKGQLAREVAVSIAAHAADLDGKLLNVSARLERLDVKLAGAKTSIGDFQRRLHGRLVMAAAAISVFLAWFGVAQVGMMGRGWQMIQNSRTAQVKTVIS